MDSLFKKTDLTEAFAALGFNTKEIQVLMFLLNVGKAPASTIALRTKMKRSSCYLILDSLIQKDFLTKTASDGILVFSVNEKYPFKAEREAHVEASKKVQKAFSQAKGAEESLDFEEIFTVGMEALNAHVNELCGIFLIDEREQAIVVKKVNFVSLKGPILKLIGKSISGMKTSLNNLSNNAAKTAKTGRPIVGENFHHFVCPVLGRQVATGIQAVSGTKILYSFPIRTEKKIYGVAIIAFRDKEKFMAEKRVFEKIMEGIADCMDLKINLYKLSLRSVELAHVQEQTQKIPSEIFKDEIGSLFAKAKIRELKNARHLIA